MPGVHAVQERPTYLYTVYGLLVAASFPFPELLPTRESGTPDVIIRYGEVPECLEEVAGHGVLYQANPHQFLFRLDSVAHYLVQNGSEIIVEQAPGSDESEMRLFLLGSCLGALLHQRGILALHASAIQTPQGAVLFAGRSGVGKSTLLSAFLRRGYGMLADDIAGLVQDASGQVMVLPAYPNTKLWHDAAEHLEHPVDTLPRIRPQLAKYHIPVGEQFSPTPARLSHVYILAAVNKTEMALTPLEKFGAFRALVNHTYRKLFLDGLGQRQPHFQMASAAASQAAVAVVERPDKPHYLLEELADMLEEDFT
jgi:hypothetical protein